ncbi:hypothetical protein BV898_14566 [Hypsibius exemplaris]|uniref:Uncharacterized protein n=1 Tax=Hypsibius exemplaris TaxID=2072580 RepID=A0A9X6N9M5_HYPEX|nr:hypothetical protein BV898_14566 [Hypsibius exemplaris]
MDAFICVRVPDKSVRRLRGSLAGTQQHSGPHDGNKSGDHRTGDQGPITTTDQSYSSQNGERFLQPVTVVSSTKTKRLWSSTREDFLEEMRTRTPAPSSTTANGAAGLRAYSANHREQLKILIGFKHHGTLLTPCKPILLPTTR